MRILYLFNEEVPLIIYLQKFGLFFLYLDYDGYDTHDAEKFLLE